MIYQVMFLKLDGNKHVASCHDCKEQVRHSHCRCGPKRDHKPEIEGMPDVLIEERRPKGQRRISLTCSIKPDLTQAKQIKVINEEGRHEYNGESEQANRNQQNSDRL